MSLLLPSSFLTTSSTSSTVSEGDRSWKPPFRKPGRKKKKERKEKKQSHEWLPKHQNSTCAVFSNSSCRFQHNAWHSGLTIGAPTSKTAHMTLQIEGAADQFLALLPHNPTLTSRARGAFWILLKLLLPAGCRYSHAGNELNN